METYYNKKLSSKLGTTIDFQIIEWWAKDEICDNNSEDSDDEEDGLRYAMYCFGRTENGKSITVKINNYNPFYYIKLPSNISSSYLSLFLKFVKCSIVLK